MPDDRRRHDTFGGLTPSGATCRAGDTLVAALALEHHAEGAALPLLVLSDAPGPLAWDPAVGLRATDDAGRAYAVAPLAVQPGLGALTATAWLEPAPPADARRLDLEVSGLARRPVRRGGGTGAPRPLAGGPWALALDLVPPRTAVPLPARPSVPPPAARPAGVPARSLGAFRGLVPVGQARVAEDATVCLHALERYEERAVLTLVVLAEPERVPPVPVAGRTPVEVFDDRAGRYGVTPVHALEGPGWSEASLELVPPPPPGAAALGIVAGRARFGVALSPP